MGNVLDFIAVPLVKGNPTRRRLVDEPKKEYWNDWRFYEGGWNYGYPGGVFTKEDGFKTFWGGMAFLTLTDLGMLAVDWREFIAMASTSIFLQEKIYRSFDNARDWEGGGSSYVFNVTGGYNFYHSFFRGNKKWLPFLAGWGIIASNLICHYKDPNGEYIAHDRHWQGFVTGLFFAWVLDQVNRKKRPLTFIP